MSCLITKGDKRGGEQQVSGLQDADLEQDVDLAVFVLWAALDIKGARATHKIVQLWQLLLAHRHVLKLTALRQHGQELRSHNPQIRLNQFNIWRLENTYCPFCRPDNLNMPFSIL